MTESNRINIVLQDNYTAPLKEAIKSTAKFEKQISKLRRELNKLERKKISISISLRDKDILNAKNRIIEAMSNLEIKAKIKPEFPNDLKTELQNQLNQIQNLTINVTPVLASQNQSGGSINPTTSPQNVLGNNNNIASPAPKPKNIVFKAVDKTKAVLGSIKNNIIGIKKFAKDIVLGDDAKAAFNATIGSAMQGEQEKVAMKHFIGIKNKDKSKEEVSSITDNYMEALKSEAGKSPFDPNDIITSGRKALSVMNGDTDKSVGLVKLAQDMAAVNPGKSVDDAMNALASMRTGDFTAAKDFGFEYSMNEYKALLDKGSKEDLTQDEMTKAFDMLLKDKATIQFAGGTEEFSKTVTGQWGIITGSLQTMGTNFGIAFLPLINEILGPLGQLLGNNTGAFVQFGQSAATVVQSIANSIGMFLTPAIEWIKTNLPMIQTIVGNVFNGIATLLQPIMTIFGSVFEIIGAAIQNFGPIVTEIAATIMGKLGEVLEWLGPKIDWLKELFISSMPMISDAVQIAWDVINPALDLGITVFEGIADAVMWAMPIVQDILEKVWVVIEPIARGIGNVLGHVFDLVKKVIGFFGISASDEKRPKGHATGLPRVPYNNYPALLHEGEVVLTKKEVNQVQNRGSNNFNMSFNISGSSDPNLVAKQIVNEIKQAAFNI
ncbi:hypothetical protein [Clostridium sp. Marseille-QA1073]